MMVFKLVIKIIVVIIVIMILEKNENLAKCKKIIKSDTIEIGPIFLTPTIRETFNVLRLIFTKV